VKRKAWISVLVMFIVTICMLPACAPKAVAPMRPPVINKFTVARQTVGLNECPVFQFGVDNAKTLIITQGGGEVLYTESSESVGASRQPLGNIAYALPITTQQPEPPYPAGIFLADFTGATTGKPSGSSGSGSSGSGSTGSGGTGSTGLTEEDMRRQREMEAIDWAMKHGDPLPAGVG
jgi:uncharacterized membrane protein YgcG